MTTESEILSDLGQRTYIGLMILCLGLYDVSWSYFTIRGQIPQMENKVQSGNNIQHFLFLQIKQMCYTQLLHNLVLCLLIYYQRMHLFGRFMALCFEHLK